MEKKNEMLIYRSEDGAIKVDVLFTDETVWLTQAQMAALFGKGRTTITEHISNVFKEGELDKEMVSRKFRHTTSSFNSPSLKTFCMCSVIVVRAFPNKAAIWSCVSQTVSSSRRTSIFILPSECWYISISPVFILVYN